MRTTLAIPTYNSLENLKNLIPRVLEEDFDAVYVLDDNSNDDTVGYISEHFPDVHVIAGEENLGPAGNRNRIIPHEQDGILFFLDADMELISKDVAAVAREMFAKHSEVLVIGNLVLNKEGRPMSWNFGPEMDPLGDARADVWLKLAYDFENNSAMLEYIHNSAMPYSHSWYLLGEEPEPRVVDWVAESNMLVRADAFAAVGGYDTAMRYHETHDLCRRLRKKDGNVVFVPNIVAKHLELDVRFERRKEDWWEAKYHFYHKHWGMSRDMFNKLFDDPLGEEIDTS